MLCKPVKVGVTLPSEAPANSFYLGRPWRNHAKTVLINCWLGKHIKPEGWHNWGKLEAEETAFYAEYNSKGPGANKKERVKWSKQLTTTQLEYYTLGKVFNGWDPSDQLMSWSSQE